MYTVQKNPDPTATMENGTDVQPVLTLKSGSGSSAHFIVDDHSYVLIHDAGGRGGGCRVTNHWFPEAFEASRFLPPLCHPAYSQENLGYRLIKIVDDVVKRRPHVVSVEMTCMKLLQEIDELKTERDNV